MLDSVYYVSGQNLGPVWSKLEAYVYMYFALIILFGQVFSYKSALLSRKSCVYFEFLVRTALCTCNAYSRASGGPFAAYN